MVIKYDGEGGFPEAGNISLISLEIRALGQLEFYSTVRILLILLLLYI